MTEPTEQTDDDAAYPPEVEAFHAVLRRLAAVREVTTGLKWLPDLPPKTYSLPGDYGDLPHALLRRTNGAAGEEAWANTEFQLSRDEAGWLTIEFLAWWVRDLSRSGEQIQLRPMALPPKAYEVQFGRTLKFIMDHFVICPGGDMSVALGVMAARAKSLNGSLDYYADILGKLVLPREAS